MKKPTTNVLFVPTFTPGVALVTQFETKRPLKFKQQPEGLFVYLDGLTADAWNHVLEVKTK